MTNLVETDIANTTVAKNESCKSYYVPRGQLVRESAIAASTALPLTPFGGLPAAVVASLSLAILWAGARTMLQAKDSPPTHLGQVIGSLATILGIAGGITAIGLTSQPEAGAIVSRAIAKGLRTEIVTAEKTIFGKRQPAENGISPLGEPCFIIRFKEATAPALTGIIAFRPASGHCTPAIISMNADPRVQLK